MANLQQPLSVIEANAAIRRGKPLARARHGLLILTVFQHEQDAWLHIGRGRTKAGMVWRVPLFTADAQVKVLSDPRHLLYLSAYSALGRHDIRVSFDEAEAALFSLELVFTPRRRINLPYMARDLVAISSAAGRTAKGRIRARQRRLNTGLCYFDLEEADLGKILYLQDLTSLNDYFRASGTKPENAVGGAWPEVGYLAPVDPSDPEMALPGGKAVTINRSYLLIRHFPRTSEEGAAWQFLDMLAAIYARLDRPEAQRRDWIERAERTLTDLQHSPKARVRHYGNVYFHPYTASEYPDVMVQLVLLETIHQWSEWDGKRSPLEREIAAGISRFHDKEIGTLRRYLPNVGADKDADAVDSWYLYRPLASLADLALRGEDWAKDLLLASIDFAIRAARHFQYKWPIQFKIDTFDVITPVAADERGQTDVGGIYAWVMLQAFSLTGDGRFLAEARAAIDTAKGMRFDLNYQANLTAWGAAACVRLWRVTGELTYLGQSYVYLASFFHNSQMWRSRIGLAECYDNFLGVTCLEDAPYMAAYECSDSFAAFEQYLDLGGPDLIPSARLLVSEYCRYALHRAWFYYPDALPTAALATENRNGHIDPKLSFPVEDLYPDGQPAGQVGQEIYGAGSAMIFATRAYHKLEGAPFLMFCDHFVRALIHPDVNRAAFSLDGSLEIMATIVLHGITASQGDRAILRDGRGSVVPKERKRGEVRYTVPARGNYTLSWS